MTANSKNSFSPALIAGTAGVLVIILGSLLLVWWQPWIHTHTLDIGSGNDVEDSDRFTEQDIYFTQSNIERGSISSRQSSGEETYRYLQRPEAVVTLYAEKFLTDINHFDIRLHLDPAVENAGSLFGSVQCTACEQQLPRLSLYVNGLEQYAHKQRINNVYVYSYTDLSHSGGSLRSLLEQSLDVGSPIYVGEGAQASVDMNTIQNAAAVIQDGALEIDADLFGQQKWYITANGVLDVAFKKVNSNESKGKDGARVRLTDLNGNTIQSYIVEGDGVESGNGVQIVQEQDIHFDAVDSGVYMLHIDPIENSDFYITDLSINTDSFVIGAGRIRTDSTLYTAVRSKHSITLAPTTTARHSIEIKNADDSIAHQLQIDSLVGDRPQIVDLDAGEYTIDSAIGVIDVDNGLVALHKDQFFQPFMYDVETVVPRDVVVTRSDIETMADGSVVLNSYYTEEEMRRLSALESKDRMLLRVEAELPISEQRALQQVLWNNYRLVDSVCGVSIWSKVDQLIASSTENPDCSNVVEQVRAVLPQYESVHVRTKELSLSDLYTVRNAETVLPGPYEYALYMKGRTRFLVGVGNQGFQATISKVDLNREPGDDRAAVYVQNIDGDVLYYDYIEDDGTSAATAAVASVDHVISLPELAAGNYFLTIEDVSSEQANDYMIHTIEANTNQFLSVDGGNFLEPTMLYVPLQTATEVQIVVPTNKDEASGGVTLNVQREDGSLFESVLFNNQNTSWSRTLRAGNYRMEAVNPRTRLFNVPVRFSAASTIAIDRLDSNAEWVLTDPFEENRFKLIDLEISYK